MALQFHISLMVTLITYVARSASDISPGSCHGGVNYEPFGCFSREYPFNNTIELPQTPDFIDTSFHLFTRGNPHTPEVLSMQTGVSGNGKSNLNPNQPIKVIIHGFLQNHRSPWVVEIIQELLQRDDVNVITVNWGAGAGFPYTQAAANTRVVGAEVERFIRLLCQTSRPPISVRNFHLIGHSLGAHIAGTAGRLLGPNILGRITGLDPADPNFSYQPPEVRLDSSDARWVDVIHTDGAPYTLYGGYGTIQPMGHIDFYPNGGMDQPGCHRDTNIYNFVEDAYYQGMTNAEYSMSCSHDRAIFLFIESINSQCQFTAYPCNSAEDFKNGRCLLCGNRPCPSMGYQADLYKRNGKFYLNTTAHTPFCGYHYLMRLKLAADSTSTSGTLLVKIIGVQGTTPSLELHSGDLIAGQILTKIMLAPSDVGQIVGVELRFQRSNSHFSWLRSRASIRLESAMIEGVRQHNTMYFCQLSMTASDSVSLHLNNGSASASSCNNLLTE